MHGGNHRSSSWLLHVPFPLLPSTHPSRVTYTHNPRSALSGSIPLSYPVTANLHRSAPHSQLFLLIRQACGQLTVIV